MGIKQFIVVFSLLIPIIVSCQNYPRFELYQLKQGTDSGQFIVTGLDSNLAFNNILRFRSADSTFLIGTDTVITDQSIIPILLRTIDAGLGIDVNQVNGQIFIESLSIEDSIYNGTVSLISKGTPLYATGVQGNYWSVAPADASDPSKMPVVVIAGEDIASGSVGLGLIKGHIKQVNTTGLADGAEVYVASGGGYTSTKPTAEGVIIQRLGTVIKGNNANGSGIINLGDEAYWNDYVDRTELSDTALAIRTDIPSLDGVVLTTTNQSISGVKTFQNNVGINGALDITDGGNTYLGYFAGNGIRQDNTTARNVIIGTEAYFTENYANDNVVIGYFAGRNTEFGGNVIIGSKANYFLSPSYVIASNAVVIGTNAKTVTSQNDNSIVIGSNATGLGDDTAVIGDGQMKKLNSNKYTFNVDQDTTGKNGYLLGLNSSSGEIELQSLEGTAVLTTTNQTIDGVKTFNDTIVGIISNSAAVDVQYISSGSYYPALISNGIGANDVRLNTNIKYDMTNNEFTLDNYVFDVDEAITGKQGQVLTLNSSGVIELDAITTLHTLTATIRDQASDSVVIMTIPTEYIGCKIIETTQSFYAENYYGSSPVIFGSISGSTFTNNGNLISEYVTGTGYLSLIRNTTGGIYTYPETITSTSKYIKMQRPVYSGSVRTITNAITIQCN
jgi:hypothetical protein